MKENMLSDCDLLKCQGFYNSSKTLTPIKSSISNIQIKSREQVQMLKNQSQQLKNEEMRDKITKRHEFCQLHFSSAKQLFQNSYSNICKTQNNVMGACAKILNIEKEEEDKHELAQKHDLIQQCEQLHEQISNMDALAQESLLQFQDGQSKIQQFSNVKQIDIPIGLDQVFTLESVIAKLKKDIIEGNRILEEKERIIVYQKEMKKILKIKFDSYHELKDTDIKDCNMVINMINHNRINYDEKLSKNRNYKLEGESAIIQFQHHSDNTVQQNLSIIRANIVKAEQNISEISAIRKEEELMQVDYMQQMSKLQKSKEEALTNQNKVLQEIDDSITANCEAQNEQIGSLKKMTDELETKNNQLQNIKNVMGFEDLKDIIKFIKSNDEVQILHNKLLCHLIIIHNYYQLCAENTQTNLQKSKNLIELLNKKRQELLQQQEEQIIRSLKEQIQQVIKELYKDLEEQQHQMLEETLELGGEELILYIAKCDFEDQILKELKMDEDPTKLSNLQEFIKEQCRDTINKQLVGIRDMFVSNMKPLSIAEQEDPIQSLLLSNHQPLQQFLKKSPKPNKPTGNTSQKKQIQPNSETKSFIKISKQLREQINKDKVNNKGKYKAKMDNFEIITSKNIVKPQFISSSYYQYLLF